MTDTKFRGLTISVIILINILTYIVLYTIDFPKYILTFSMMVTIIDVPLLIISLSVIVSFCNQLRRRNKTNETVTNNMKIYG